MAEKIQEKSKQREAVSNFLTGRTSEAAYSEETKPLELYFQETKQPYATDLLQMHDLYQAQDPDVQLKVNTIHLYITEQLKMRGLDPVVGAYKQVFEELRNDLQLDQFTHHYLAFGKIYAYVRAAVEYQKQLGKVGVSYTGKPKIKDISPDDLQTILN